jgi:nicotinamidase-related amidase
MHNILEFYVAWLRLLDLQVRIMKALLIIDMQKGSFTHATPRFDADGVVKRINLLSSKFREMGDMVIFVQHDGSRDGNFIPGADEWEILPTLEKQPTDFVLPKIANDSFYRTSLMQILQEKSIREIVVTGCATDFCVDSTVKSALIQDFDTVVISDCHTTGNRPGIESHIVVNYFNWLWSEMIPTQGSITVVDFARYLKSINYMNYE